MTPNEYEMAIAKFDTYPENKQTEIYVLGLCGEAGEVADKFKKIIRDKNGKFEMRDEKILKELGDVLWYMVRIGSWFGYSLDEIMIANHEKLQSRWERKKIGGSGDNR